MTEDALIGELVDREGGFVNNVSDRGGATKFGITAAAWGIYKRFGRPATVAEVQAITRVDSVGFYRRRLRQSPFMVIADEALRVQLFDFGVQSGDARAIRWLQRVLRVPVTSEIDDRTKVAMVAYPAFLLNEALIGARLKMLMDIVASDPSQATFVRGWCARAAAFSQLMTPAATAGAKVT